MHNYYKLVPHNYVNCICIMHLFKAAPKFQQCLRTNFNTLLAYIQVPLLSLKISFSFYYGMSAISRLEFAVVSVLPSVLLIVMISKLEFTVVSMLLFDDSNLTNF